MEKNEFTDKLQNEYMKLVLLPKVQSFYQELKETLQNYKIINYYIKTKKSSDSTAGQGLESVFFDDKLIHWLVIDATSIKFNSIPINKINLVYFTAKNDKKTLGFREQPDTDELQLNISFSGAPQNSIMLNSDALEFSKLLKFKNSLLSLI
jgi:hypothetical protein